MLVSAIAEVVSLGAVLPFLGVLTAPERLFGHPIVAEFARTWGVTSASELILPLTVLFIAAALFAGALRMLLLWTGTRLAFASGADLSIEVYRRTLYQPYHVHIARNSSEVISGLTHKVNSTSFILQHVGVMISSIVLVASITVALLAINAKMALVAAVGFGISYGLITWAFRKRLIHDSHLMARETTQVVKAVQEGLGAIRDVLLDNTQPLYCEIYRRSDQSLRVAMANTIFIGGSPRFAMEAVGMVLIAVLAYHLSGQAEGVATALPMLGALALGAQRVLPALQQCYASWVGIAAGQGSLADTLELLEQPVPADALEPAPAPLRFQKAICFDAVRFRYTSDGPWVLDGITLTIPKSGRVGFVGTTGAGKSTMLDLLMGLMEPTQGQILVDGLPISGTSRRAWQRTIAHVPQTIYLADTTLAENIAFGVQRENIDMERVRQAADQARIADFIESRAAGYDTMVGERGIRLSGGQRQRIGIARALYKQATVLVFDEATSALDNATEQDVMDAIEGLDHNLTIVVVAHRITTVRRCDTIVELRHGQIAAQGPYDDLLECSPSFRDLTKTAAAPDQLSTPVSAYSGGAKRRRL